jgi:hypothetical protein
VEFEDRSISSAPGPPLTQSRTQSRRVDRSLVFVSTDSLSLASSNYKKNTRSTVFLADQCVQRSWLFRLSFVLME